MIPVVNNIIVAPVASRIREIPTCIPVGLSLNAFDAAGSRGEPTDSVRA